MNLFLLAPFLQRARKTCRKKPLSLCIFLRTKIATLRNISQEDYSWKETVENVNDIAYNIQVETVLIFHSYLELHYLRYSEIQFKTQRMLYFRNSIIIGLKY